MANLHEIFLLKRFFNKVFKIEIRYFLECTLSITKVDLLFSTIDNSYNAR